MTRHRWGETIPVTPHKSESECRNGCGIVKVSRNEWEGGRAVYWTEFWRGLDRIEGKGTPVCESVNATAYERPHVNESAYKA